MLTSLGTPPGNNVAADGTGWVIADGPDAIANALKDMQADHALLRKCGDAAAKLWRRHYADYFERAIAGDYLDAVRDLTGYAPKGQVLTFPRVAKHTTGRAGV
jgi:glycosyltransferase involved in cell wall biosynthesis